MVNRQFKSVLYIASDFQLYIGRLRMSKGKPDSPLQLFGFALEGGMKVALNGVPRQIEPQSIFYRRSIRREICLDGIYAYLFLKPGNPYRQTLQYRMTQVAESAYVNIDYPDSFRDMFDKFLLERPPIEDVRHSLDRVILNDRQHMLYEESIDPRVEAIMNIIQQNPTQQFAVEELANMVYLSPSRLMGLFKQEADMTLGKFSAFNKLVYAYYLIAQGYTLAAAAESAGFYDDSHLSKTSRKFIGILPSLLFSPQVNTKVISTKEYASEH